MKRRLLLKLVLFLLLGAIVNVAVAWAFTGFGDSVGGSFVTLNVTAPGSGSRSFVKIEILRVGWPFDSLEAEAIYAVPHYGVPVTGTRLDSRGVLFLERPNTTLLPYQFGFLPVLPTWPGFAINTAFYAVALWLLFAAPLALRRRRRIKRGLCPKCAYDLRGTQTGVCPECGATR